MSEPDPRPDDAPLPGPTVEATPDRILDEASRTVRAPWAASVAGILFSLSFTAALALLRTQALITSKDEDVAHVFETGQDLPAVIGGLYLAPLAGIMFLWFLAVVRDQVGDREDRFFATVFLGSGLLFVGLLFTAAAVASAPVVAVRYLGLDYPTAADVQSARALAYTLLFAFATRVGAVFLISTATVGLRSGTLSRWIVATGYVVGLVLLLFVAFWDWAILALPAWVAVASLIILRRERAMRLAARAAGSA